MVETGFTVYLLAGAGVFIIGFHALLAQAHLLRRIMALNVMGSGVFMVFIALSARTAGEAPDPVPHAMVLTGIVVSDYYDRAGEAAMVMAGWIQAGKLKTREDIVDGLENFPNAFDMLFTGANNGKLVLKVA